MIVTSHGRAGYLTRALTAGVRGFLPKTVSAQVLADVVRTVQGGGRYVDPELAAEAISAGDRPLSPREADVLELVVEGAPVERSPAGRRFRPGRSAGGDLVPVQYELAVWHGKMPWTAMPLPLGSRQAECRLRGGEHGPMWRRWTDGAAATLGVIRCRVESGRTRTRRSPSARGRVGRVWRGRG